MKAAGTPAKTSSNGSKTSEPPKIMWSPAQSAILPTPADPDSQTDHDKEGHRTRSHNSQLHKSGVFLCQPQHQIADLRAGPRATWPVRVRPLACDQLAVPDQQRARCDEPAGAQHGWKQP